MREGNLDIYFHKPTNVEFQHNCYKEGGDFLNKEMENLSFQPICKTLVTKRTGNYCLPKILFTECTSVEIKRLVLKLPYVEADVGHSGCTFCMAPFAFVS